MIRRLAFVILFACIGMTLGLNVQARTELEDFATLSHLISVAEHHHTLTHHAAHNFVKRHSHKHRHATGEPEHEHHHGDSSIFGMSGTLVVPHQTNFVLSPRLGFSSRLSALSANIPVSPVLSGVHRPPIL